MLMLNTINLHTEFEMPSYFCSRDMVGNPDFLNGLFYPDRRWFVIPKQMLAVAHLCAKFEDSSFAHAKDMKEDQNKE